MRHSIALLYIAFLLLLQACQQGAVRKEPTSSLLLQAGVSAAPVNPPLGAFIAGDKQNRRFTGILDSLFIKAVVLYDGQTAIALLTVDCIGLLHPTVEAIRQEAALLTGDLPLPPENIIVSSTHTHAGPDVVGIWGSDYQHSGVDSAYMAFLVATAAEQVRKAAGNLRPVHVLSAQTEAGHEWVQNICNEEIDRSLNVLQMVDTAGKTVASLTNFACHPTYLDANFSEVSSDYVAGFYREMATRLGGEHLFLQGAIGGWVQPVDGEGTPQKAYNRGAELANIAISALATSPDTLKSWPLQIKRASFSLALTNEAWKQLAAIGTIRRELADSVRTEVVWLAIGEAQFATHPGETAPWYGLETKRLMKTSGPKFVLGLGMDALGYILKPAYFEDSSLPHARYLTSMSVGKDAGAQLMQALERLIPQ